MRRSILTQRQLLRIGVLLQKPVNLLLVFLMKNRARCVKQFTTLCQALPQLRQNECLLANEGRHIRLAAQPFDIHMPPDYARRGTWHIGQNTIKRPAIPPSGSIRRIARYQLGFQFQALQVFFRTAQSASVTIHGHQVHISQLKNMAGLATWRAAGIQHTHAGGEIKQGGRPLRTCILHRDIALKKSGDTLDGDRLGQGHRAAAKKTCGYPGICQLLAVGFDAKVAAIDTQGHGRMLVACQQHGLPLLRILMPQLVHPPLGIGVTGDIVSGVNVF